jgi:branched-subunit amino acid aminotransferase/4-amino-4-deoxychorismate lyase
LADVDAIFATNAAVGIRTVRAIDGIQLPDEHPFLGVLCQEYADIPAELL